MQAKFQFYNFFNNKNIETKNSTCWRQEHVILTAKQLVVQAWRPGCGFSKEKRLEHEIHNDRIQNSGY